MDTSLKFPLTEVKENGELAVKASVPPEEFPKALTEGTLVGPVSVEGMIRRVDDDAVFEGTAKGKWRFECTRCLAPVDGAWNEKVDSTAPIDGGPMDLADDVRQAIALAEPMRILCRPDCKGLCATCRGNLNLKDCGHEQPKGDAAVSRKPRLTPKPHKG